ncbi:hypothetical protein DVH05_002868 [Phytophthora capsici]|nr:hypothetical protein DVH05_002868 [Phytophthora capsici]
MGFCSDFPYLQRPDHHPPVRRDLTSLFAEDQSQSDHADDGFEANNIGREGEEDSEDDEGQDPLEHWDEGFQELAENDSDQHQEQQPRNGAFVVLGLPDNPPFPPYNGENFP